MNMAVAHWLVRRRTLRRGNSGNRGTLNKNDDKDPSIYDPNKDDEENTLRILSNVCTVQGLEENQKIPYLNALNKILKQSRKNNAVFFMKNEHIMRCIKTCLISNNSVVRAAGYRVILKCITTAEDVVTLNELQISKLLTRSIDLGMVCQEERRQAFRIILKILAVNPKELYIGILRTLISLADVPFDIRDKVHGYCTFLLCCLGMVNAELLIDCYGHHVMLKSAVYVSDARLNECVLQCLMFLMNKRSLRERADIHLDYVMFGYTEWEKKRTLKSPPESFKMNELSVLAILRSWIGLYHFWQPNISGIKIIVDLLYLRRTELRKAMLELLCQVFGLDRKLWTDEINVAIGSIHPERFHESWTINHKFVVAEGRDILPPKNLYRPNMSEIHSALVLYAFMECGITSALVEIIVCPDPFLSVKALALLGVIIHLSYKLLPAEIVDVGPSLPTLAYYIAHGSPYQKKQAIEAVSVLSKMNEVLRKKPEPKSLFLKQLVYYSESYDENEAKDLYNELIEEKVLCEEKKEEDNANDEKKEGDNPNEEKKEGDNANEEKKEGNGVDEENKGENVNEEKKEGDHANEEKQEEDNANEEQKGGDSLNEGKEEGDNANEEKQEEDNANEEQKGGDNPIEGKKEGDNANEEKQEGDNANEEEKEGDNPNEGKEGGDNANEEKKEENEIIDEKKEDEKAGGEKKDEDNSNDNKQENENTSTEKKEENQTVEEKKNEENSNDEKKEDEKSGGEKKEENETGADKKKESIIFAIDEKDEMSEEDGGKEVVVEKKEIQIKTETDPNEIQEKLNFYFLQLEFERRNKNQEMRKVDQHINKSNVLWFADHREWRWGRIEASLKSTDECFIRLQESYHKSYIKRLLKFFKPSSRLYSEFEYRFEKRKYDVVTRTAFYLMDFLLQSDESEKEEMLDDFLLDLSKELQYVVVNQSLYTVFFNPRHMLHTISQHYFLIIGRLSGTRKGIEALSKRSILKLCMEIVISCRHEYYVKLIISSLNYNIPGATRQILSKALYSSTESVRIYATQLLLILARLHVHDFGKWGIELLITLTHHKDENIASISFNILEELCYDDVYVESLLDMKPFLFELMEKSDLLLVRLLSCESGFRFLSEANYVESEILNWEKEYSYRYPGLVEQKLHKSLTLRDIYDYEKNFKRLTYYGYKHADAFIPFHLYGELSKHEEGFQALVRNGHIFKMAQNIHERRCESDTEITELKSSLWGLSNMSTSKLGFEFLEKENIIPAIVGIAYDCPVLTVRETAFYCLSLIATTVAGADALDKHEWHTVRRNRSEEWPDMNVRLSFLEEVWKCRLEKKESFSSPVVSPSDFNETDSVPESPEIDSSHSPEKTSTLRERLFKKTKSSEKESFDGSQSSVTEGEKYTSSGADVFEEYQGTSDDDTFYEKKNSSVMPKADESVEGTKRFRPWKAVSFHNLRSLYKNRKERKSKSDSKVELLELPPREILSKTEAANTLSSSSSQVDLVSESTQEILPDKFALSYKGVSLPKSLSQIFTNTPNPDSIEVETEVKPEPETLSNPIVKESSPFKTSIIPIVKRVTINEQDCFESVTTDDEDEYQIPFVHNMETCIDCSIKVNERFTSAQAGESDEPEDGSLTYDAAEILPRASENPAVDDAVKPKQSTTSGEDATKENNASESKEEDPTVEDEENVRQIVTRQIIEQIDRMFNSIVYKQAKQELILLRHRYPTIFRDACLYSDICDILASSPCRPPCRYFIQQLFSYPIYYKVHEDAARVLRMYIPEDTSSMADILPLISESNNTVQNNSPPLELYKPREIKTIVANPGTVDKKNPFGAVRLTRFRVHYTVAHTQTRPALVL